MKKFNAVNVIVILIIWTLITMVPTLYKLQGNTQELGATLTTGISYPLMLAALFILTVVVITGNTRATGLHTGRVQNPRVLLLPAAIMVIVITSLAFTRTLTSGYSVFITLLNCTFVGISEELMFRGVLFRGMVNRLGFKKGALITIVTFGLIHVLNAFITGNIINGILQAFLAMLSGIFYLALRVKCATIVPGIILHALWDASLLLFNVYQKSIQTEFTSHPLVMFLSLFVFLVPVILAVAGIRILLQKDTAPGFLSKIQ